MSGSSLKGILADPLPRPLTDGTTIFNPQCLCDNPAMYSFPTYPFDPTILNTSVGLVTLDTPYLHILPSDYTPPDAGFSSQVFADYILTLSPRCNQGSKTILLQNVKAM
jgi:hypothetical protein